MLLPDKFMQSHATSEFTLATTSIAIGTGHLMNVWVAAEPILADISYLVAIVAGAMTMYSKLKRK